MTRSFCSTRGVSALPASVDPRELFASLPFFAR